MSKINVKLTIDELEHVHTALVMHGMTINEEIKEAEAEEKNGTRRRTPSHELKEQLKENKSLQKTFYVLYHQNKES